MKTNKLKRNNRNYGNGKMKESKSSKCIPISRRKEVEKKRKDTEADWCPNKLNGTNV